jgi:polysaccharide export outer membrane protein
MHLIHRVAVALVCAALLAACASGADALRDSSPSVVTVAAQLPAPDTTPGSHGFQDGMDYRLGAQDVLEVSVLGQPELARTVRVNRSGRISLPLAGTLQAGGMTVEELQGAIAARLRDGYFQDPQVSVFVKEYASQQVTVGGSVEKPGVYPLVGETSLLEAISMAEGMDPLADPRGAVVFRTIDGTRMAAVFDVKAIRAGQMPDPRVYAGDIVMIEQSGSKTALRRFIETVPALAFFSVF